MISMMAGDVERSRPALLSSSANGVKDKYFSWEGNIVEKIF